MISQEKDLTPTRETPLQRHPHGNTRCVLLAEDDRALRRYLEVVLDRAGFDVITAGDGLEAIRATINANIDVVVTDAVMPNLDGNELCRFFRNSPSLSNIPIVLLSALERRDDPATESVDAFLAKPVSPDELVRCLHRLLQTTI